MLTVSANVGGVVADIEDVYIDSEKLTITTDFTLSNNEITIKLATLAELDEGEYVITVETDVGPAKTKLAVVDTEE